MIPHQKGDRRTGFRAFLAAGLSLLAVAAHSSEPGSVQGRVTLGVPGMSLAQVDPVVVYLEPTASVDPNPTPPPDSTMRQRDARFMPPFSVVVVGQKVDMLNEDAIYHNVFSYSRPNDFDLGIYPAGESRAVTFGYPGVVKTYCSIHENMNATILVTPTRHFDRVSASGSFEIDGVPPGRYRLRVWCEKLPPIEREITVVAGERNEIDLEFKTD